MIFKRSLINILINVNIFDLPKKGDFYVGLHL